MVRARAVATVTARAVATVRVVPRIGPGQWLGLGSE